MTNVVIEPIAAGSVAGTRDFFVRGERSAVNSLFPDSCYAHVTSILRVPVVPLDDLVDDAADVVKIDVEGGELDVLEGMPRMLRRTASSRSSSNGIRCSSSWPATARTPCRGGCWNGAGPCKPLRI